MDHNQKSGCVIGTGSVNRAIQAKNLLASAAVFSKVVKSDGKGGCSYGVSLACAEAQKALGILRKAGIKGNLLTNGL